WLAPPDGATFAAGSRIELSARATDSDGRISYVDFLINSNLFRRIMGSPSNSVYVAVWSNAPAGTFELRAVAADNAGAFGRSEPVHIVVTGSETNRPPTNDSYVVNLGT